ncbi:uncharacterized protein K452DRAFT_115828 [Aplosporella prunicola CBS 121167]|uniref:Uncharacterized protein n=1 Tax=Aplosporella prunicola CBS 121167 TaxID=1176127 RepID=A0A6A6B168_9PEZI|nr:uncharacterized protein K452DRAFT_115828 [Aplosporella prunicola CBS 121167]KAF2136964.1 hypothetical protein K452DRAFT_115828 [Aplosporella prunicola CBS 121167]
MCFIQPGCRVVQRTRVHLPVCLALLQVLYLGFTPRILTSSPTSSILAHPPIYTYIPPRAAIHINEHDDSPVLLPPPPPPPP